MSVAKTWALRLLGSLCAMSCLACSTTNSPRSAADGDAEICENETDGPETESGRVAFISKGQAQRVREDGEPWKSAGGWLSVGGCNNFLHAGMRIGSGDFKIGATMRTNDSKPLRVVMDGNNYLLLGDASGTLKGEGPWFEGDAQGFAAIRIEKNTPFAFELARRGDTLTVSLDGVSVATLPFTKPGFGTIGFTPALGNWLLGACSSKAQLFVSEFWAEGRLSPIQEKPVWKDLYTPGEAGYAAFRIPALMRTKSGIWLVFVEGRKTGLGDSGPIDVLLKRSTDGGRSFGALTNVVGNGLDTYGNPVPILDRLTGFVWLVFSRNDGGVSEAEINAGQGRRELWVTHSEDEGRSWVAAREISASVLGADWRWVASGPGHGLQLENGRLLAPINYTTGSAGSEGFSGVIYSDDHGASWQRGGIVGGANGDEASVALRADGVLLINFRSKYDVDRRGVATSADGGQSFGAGQVAGDLIDPHCEGSVLGLRGDVWRELATSQAGILLVSNAASSRRELLSLHASLDGGLSWPLFTWVLPGAAAYSDIAELDDGALAIVCERGRIGPYDAISMTTLTKGWITGGWETAPRSGR